MRLAQHRFRFDVKQLNVSLFVASHEQLSVLAERARVGNIKKTRKGFDSLTSITGIEHNTTTHNRSNLPTSCQKLRHSDMEQQEKMQCD